MASVNKIKKQKKITTFPKKEKSFAKQFAELEKIVESFDQEDIHLDEGLERFERGLQLAEELKKTLSDVENTVETLKRRYSLDD